MLPSNGHLLSVVGRVNAKQFVKYSSAVSFKRGLLPRGLYGMNFPAVLATKRFQQAELKYSSILIIQI
jgi:hypothetical protein